MTKSTSSLRLKLKQYVEAAYLHGLPVENLDTGELEPPADISDTDWIVDQILDLIAQEVKRVIGEDDVIPTIPPNGDINLQDEYLKAYNFLRWEQRRKAGLV